MRSVKSVGAEFYGSSSSSPSSSFQPFPSLERLHFGDMLEWGKWEIIGGKEFLGLRYLSLSYCRKLKRNLPRNLPSLTELELVECPLLLESDGNISSNIKKSSSDHVFRQLMQHLPSLTKLSPSRFPYLTSFPREDLHKTLQSLCISQCPNLEFLPHEYTSLENLIIKNSCDSMTSFALGSLSVLKSLDLQNCKSLKSVSTATQNGSISFLQSIFISDCGELESLWQGGFLSTPNLICLNVDSCHKLQSLPVSIHTLTGLQELTIIDLPNLNSSFAREGLPVNLRKLDAAAINAFGLQRLSCLSQLRLGICDYMVKALINTELPSSLVSLKISFLHDIKSLEGTRLQHLTSLQQLNISYCYSLESLPKEGFPSSLLVLRVHDCPLQEASYLRKWGKERRKIAGSIPFIFINYKQVNI